MTPRREALSAARLSTRTSCRCSPPARTEHTPALHRDEYVNGPSGRRHAARAQRSSTRPRPSRWRATPHGLDYAHRAGVVHRDLSRGTCCAEEMEGHQARGLRHRQGGRATASRRSAPCSGPPPTSHPSRRAARRPARRPTSTRSACARTSSSRAACRTSTPRSPSCAQAAAGPVAPITRVLPRCAPELDQAVRVALEHRTRGTPPRSRWREEIEAGVRGEADSSPRSGSG